MPPKKKRKIEQTVESSESDSSSSDSSSDTSTTSSSVGSIVPSKIPPATDSRQPKAQGTPRQPLPKPTTAQALQAKAPGSTKGDIEAPVTAVALTPPASDAPSPAANGGAKVLGSPQLGSGKLTPRADGNAEATPQTTPTAKPGDTPPPSALTLPQSVETIPTQVDLNAEEVKTEVPAPIIDEPVQERKTVTFAEIKDEGSTQQQIKAEPEESQDPAPEFSQFLVDLENEAKQMYSKSTRRRKNTQLPTFFDYDTPYAAVFQRQYWREQNGQFRIEAASVPPLLSEADRKAVANHPDDAGEATLGGILGAELCNHHRWSRHEIETSKALLRKTGKDLGQVAEHIRMPCREVIHHYYTNKRGQFDELRAQLKRAVTLKHTFTFTGTKGEIDEPEEDDADSKEDMYTRRKELRERKEVQQMPAFAPGGRKRGRRNA